MVFLVRQGLFLFASMCGLHYIKPISAFLSRHVKLNSKSISSGFAQNNNNRLFMSSSNSGHDYSSSGSTISPDIESIMQRIKAHQDTVPRPTFAEEVRTLIESSIK